jgi:hypothetical protein
MKVQHFRIDDPVRDDTTTIVVKSDDDVTKRTVGQIVGMSSDMNAHVKDMIQDISNFDELEAERVNPTDLQITKEVEK